MLQLRFRPANRTWPSSTPALPFRFCHNQNAYDNVVYLVPNPIDLCCVLDPSTSSATSSYSGQLPASPSTLSLSTGSRPSAIGFYPNDSVFWQPPASSSSSSDSEKEEEEEEEQDYVPIVPQNIFPSSSSEDNASSPIPSQIRNSSSASAAVSRSYSRSPSVSASPSDESVSSPSTGKRACETVSFPTRGLYKRRRILHDTDSEPSEPEYLYTPALVSAASSSSVDQSSYGTIPLARWDADSDSETLESDLRDTHPDLDL